MSGNGIRCLAWVAAARAWPATTSSTSTPAAGRRHVQLERARRPVVAADVDMGPVTFEPACIPVAVDDPFDLEAVADGVFYRGDAAGIGNPHFVLFVDDPDAVPVTTHGPVLEHDPRFPRRTNVEFVARDPCRPDRDARVGTGRGGDAVVRHRRVRGRRGRAPAGAGRYARAGRRARRHADGDARRRPCTSAVRSCTSSTWRFRSKRCRVRCMSPSRSHQNRQRRRLTATEVDLERSATARAARRHRVRHDERRGGGGLARRARAPRRHRGRRSRRARAPTPHDARSRHVHRQGQGRGAAGARRRARHRRGGRSTTSSRPRSSATSRSCSRSTSSTASR